MVLLAGFYYCYIPDTKTQAPTRVVPGLTARQITHDEAPQHEKNPNFRVGVLALGMPVASSDTKLTLLAREFRCYLGGRVY